MSAAVGSVVVARKVLLMMLMSMSSMGMSIFDASVTRVSACQFATVLELDIIKTFH